MLLRLLLAADQADNGGIAGVGMLMARDVFQPEQQIAVSVIASAHQIAVFVIAILIVLMVIHVFRHAAAQISVGVIAVCGMGVYRKIRNEMALLHMLRLRLLEPADQRPIEARVGMLMLLITADRFPLRPGSRLHSAHGKHEHYRRQNGGAPAEISAHFTPLHCSCPPPVIKIYVSCSRF